MTQIKSRKLDPKIGTRKTKLDGKEFYDLDQNEQI